MRDEQDRPRVSNDSPEVTDGELLALARAGDKDAFGILYQRHRRAAEYVARKHVRSQAEAEDAASEGFLRVMSAISRGGGPEGFFRAYYLQAVSRLAMRSSMHAAKVSPTENDDLDQAKDEPDLVMSRFDCEAIAAAFRSLPQRWQTVLWHTEVEEMKPAQLAPMLGLSPNSVAALALRAREGLRQAYLQQHTAPPAAPECAAVHGRLAAYTRGRLKGASYREVHEHLEHCAGCTSRLVCIKDAGAGLRAWLFPWLPLSTLGLPAAGTTGTQAHVLRGPGKLIGRLTSAAHPAAAITTAGLGLVATAALSLTLVGIGSPQAPEENVPAAIAQSSPAAPPSRAQTPTPKREPPAPKTTPEPAPTSPTAAPEPTTTISVSPTVPATASGRGQPKTTLPAPSSAAPSPQPVPSAGPTSLPQPPHPRILNYGWSASGNGPETGFLVVDTGTVNPSRAVINILGPVTAVPNPEAEGSGWTCSTMPAQPHLPQHTVCFSLAAPSGKTVFPLTANLRGTSPQTVTIALGVPGAAPVESHISY